MNITDGDKTMADDDENDEFDENAKADDMFEYVVSQVCKQGLAIRNV